MGLLATLCPQRGQLSVQSHPPNTAIDDRQSVPIHLCDGATAKYALKAMKEHQMAAWSQIAFTPTDTKAR
jgi:hypothetical protein